MKVPLLTFAACVAVMLGSATAAEKITLTVSTYHGIDLIVKDAIPGWTKNHPDVEIKLANADFPEYQNGLVAALASGNGLPDVMALEFQFVSRIIETGGVEDLAKPPYEVGRLRNRFLAFSLPQVTTDTGVIGAIPTDVGPGTLFYRKDILERSGVTEAELTRSWASYIGAGKKIREKTGAALLASAADMKDVMIRVGVKPGEGIYFDKNHKVLIDAPRFVRALTMARQVRADKLDARIAAWSEDWRHGWTGGTFATQMMGAWLSGQMATWGAPDAKGLWRAAPLPEGASASFGGTFYAIPKKAAHKALAWQFIQYMTLDKEQQQRAFKKYDAFPALLAAQDDPFFEQPVEFLGGQKARVVWRELANRIPPMAVDRNDALAEQAVKTALDEVLEQGKDPAEALTAQKKYIERLIWSGHAR
jgi:multiple sugar transport system substrate-binding protein